MGNFFYWIYKITGRYKIASLSVLFVFMALCIYTLTTAKFEEDILSVVPKNEKVLKVGSALEGLKLNNQLVVHLYLKDSTQTNPQQLIETAQTVEDSLLKNASEYIADIEAEVSDSLMLSLYDYYYQNLPFYLEAGDYEAIAERTSPEGVTTSIQKFYRSLMSPVGIVTRKMMVKDPLSLTSFPLLRAGELQLDENFKIYSGHIVTGDEKHLIFLINLANPANETKNNGLLVHYLEGLKTQIEAENNAVVLEYFGSAAVAVANASRVKTDVYLTVGIAMVLLFVFISLFYRRIWAFFIIVLPGAFGALAGITILVLLRDSISVISLAVGSVLLGTTIDYALHFFTHSKTQKDRLQLFKDLAWPTLLCSITTACAFFSLLFIRSSALQDLGIFAGASVTMSALFTLIVLPHFSVYSGEEQEEKQPNFVEKAVQKMATYPLHKKMGAWLVFGALTLVSLFTWTNFGFDSDMLKLSYMPDDLAEYEEHLNEISNVSANKIFVATSGADIWDALEKSQELVKKLDQLDETDQILSYIALNKMIPPRSVQKERLERWNTFWNQEKKEQVVGAIDQNAGELGFAPGTFKDFSQMLSSANGEITDQSAEVMLEAFGDNFITREKSGEVAIIAKVNVDPDKKQEILSQLENVPQAIILDRGYLTSKLVVLLKEDFNKLVNISFLVVLIIVLLSYGRIELSLIALLPIAVSWLWVLGMMGAFNIQFNIVNVIICTFIFGLGIDYSIFMLKGLLNEYTTGEKHLPNYKKSIILSVFTTMAGIGVMVFAEHPSLKSIALLAVIGILSVVLITFVLQPLLFNFFMGKRKRKRVMPFTLSSLWFTIFAFVYFLLGCILLLVIRAIFVLPLGSLKFRKKVFHYILMLFCRSLTAVTVNFRKEFVDRSNLNFDKPSLIIANHHSFIDIILMLTFSPKVVMVTNDWVYNSPFFGLSVKFADFILASKGVENQLDKIERLIQEGFSIIVFPEGTRSETFKLRRFHKGAFFLAEQYKLDVQPVILHGTNLVMTKGDDFYLKNNKVTIKCLPRIKHDDPAFGEGYSQRTKKISAHFKAEYNKLRREVETPSFFKETLVKNFIYKGPVLEWYLRVKLKLENYYELFHEMIPYNARVVDIGCGYGYVSYALGLSSEDREILGIDYDGEKVNVAQECPVKPDNIQFDVGDAVTYETGKADVFLISDVLHYLLVEEQVKVMNSMLSNLNEGGMIIIRDGDSSREKNRHKGSELTEVFSTGTGFNKTRNALNFISAEFVEDFAQKNNLQLEIIDNTKRTSNVIFVLKRS